MVPVVDNDGKPFTGRDHTAFEEFVVERFGGITRLPAMATGTWKDAEKLYRDKTRVYVIAVVSVTQGEKIAEVVAFAKQHFRQEAIYLRYLGLAEIL